MFDGPYTLFAFLSVFTVASAAVIARGMRGLLSSPPQVGSALSALLFGLVFLAMPFWMGVREFGPLFLAAQTAIIIVSVALVLAFGQQLRFALSQKHVPALIVGGMFFVVGMGVAGVSLREGQLGQALTFGGLFAGVGAIVFVIGLRELMGGESQE